MLSKVVCFLSEEGVVGRGCRAKRVSYEEGVARVRESGVVEKSCRQGEKEGVARSRCQQGTSNWCYHKWVSGGGEKKVSPEVGVARERERVVSPGTQEGVVKDGVAKGRQDGASTRWSHQERAVSPAAWTRVLLEGCVYRE